ncbi:hypothetical protein BSCG_02205 [Bacteroides sp. 2_2_4]|jgi:hypothetical protein|uniref:Uncharacterized protein n=2 Tax=Bacteroidales TaxID=171549 RepID=A0A5C6K938_PARDI|nr:hypothetical protein BSCG_02205 [Bacteroides sp. 2_2_4]EGX26246.1 hypothetical protein BSAG_04934 [Bacteroides sp. D1]KAA2371532.1 hypothetical protein F2Y13_03325 [Alistipes shahii]TWV58886.1 hypothetical protein FSA05_20150 [Parabacteroides distasonis]
MPCGVMAGSKENPPMTIMGDYPIKVLGYKFGNSFYLLPTLYKRIYMQYIITVKCMSSSGFYALTVRLGTKIAKRKKL